MQHIHSRIYQESLKLIEHGRVVIDQLPPGYGFLADQLRRAVASVTLNFAEGCGKRTARDRRRFFDIAKGSVYEVAAVLDVAACFGVVSDTSHEQGQARCQRLAGMLARYG